MKALAADGLGERKIGGVLGVSRESVRKDLGPVVRTDHKEANEPAKTGCDGTKKPPSRRRST